jgi:hypothetical protein
MLVLIVGTGYTKHASRVHWIHTGSFARVYKMQTGSIIRECWIPSGAGARICLIFFGELFLSCLQDRVKRLLYLFFSTVALKVKIMHIKTILE